MANIENRMGNLFDMEDADALAHGCNCAGAMGRGIAVEFKRRWPSMYEEYHAYCHAGHFAPGDIFVWMSPDGEIIYNLGTQKHWRTQAELAAVVAAVEKMIDHASRHDIRRIAMPRIAAGLGGLKWADVEAVIRPVIQASDVEVVVCQIP